MSTFQHKPFALIQRISDAIGAKGDRRMRAVLRRSLASEPGEDLRAVALLESMIANMGAAKDELNGPWARQCAYLVAGLMAIAPDARSLRSGANVGDAFAAKSPFNSDAGLAAERRLAQLVDADEDQIAVRLRAAIQWLGTDAAPDYSQLFRDLCDWSRDDRSVQRRWLRSYYKHNSASDEVGAATESSPETLVA